MSRSYNGAMEFYTVDETRTIEVEVRLGDKDTILWSTVLSTLANAFHNNGPLTIKACRAINEGLMRLEKDAEEPDIEPDMDEEDDDARRTH